MASEHTRSTKSWRWWCLQRWRPSVLDPMAITILFEFMDWCSNTGPCARSHCSRASYRCPSGMRKVTSDPQERQSRKRDDVFNTIVRRWTQTSHLRKDVAQNDVPRYSPAFHNVENIVHQLSDSFISGIRARHSAETATVQALCMISGTGSRSTTACTMN